MQQLFSTNRRRIDFRTKVCVSNPNKVHLLPLLNGYPPSLRPTVETRPCLEGRGAETVEGKVVET